mmetsp:Transcript_9279/g.23630  ORF Transcript_9279/g.23630 Transcript_9279/m.23630 type:complete len:110 (+) Transcript_9279:86-415(+)
MSHRWNDDDPDATEDQEFLKRRQDEQLDMIQGSIGRLGDFAKNFADEIRSQGAKLDSLGQDMEASNETLHRVERKTAELVEQAGGPGWFCLTAILSGIAFVLFLLIIYT